jgi:hypothetical protein
MYSPAPLVRTLPNLRFEFGAIVVYYEETKRELNCFHLIMGPVGTYTITTQEGVLHAYSYTSTLTRLLLHVYSYSTLTRLLLHVYSYTPPLIRLLLAEFPIQLVTSCTPYSLP